MSDQTVKEHRTPSPHTSLPQERFSATCLPTPWFSRPTWPLSPCCHPTTPQGLCPCPWKEPEHGRRKGQGWRCLSCHPLGLGLVTAGTSRLVASWGVGWMAGQRPSVSGDQHAVHLGPRYLLLSAWGLTITGFAYVNPILLVCPPCFLCLWITTGKDWEQEEKGETEDELVGWHHWLNGHESEQIPRDSEGQGSLACCSPWDHRVGHDLMIEQQHLYIKWMNSKDLL